MMDLVDGKSVCLRCSREALLALAAVFTLVVASYPGLAGADEACWPVEQVKAGMKGHGLTVIRGTKPERFEFEILGVLRHFEPGRDMVIARLSGLGLEKSGVMAGMSGSPVYCEDRLLGAVAYTWEFSLEPIAGITFFCQMDDFSRRLAKSAPEGTAQTVELPDDFLVSSSSRQTTALSRPRMVPIATPVSVSGMSRTALAALDEHLRPMGMVALQGGGPTDVADERSLRLEPGSAMAVGLMVGEVSATAIGSTTAVDEHRIHALGHPFLELGNCRLPLMTAYIHTVMPLQSASFKMGSPLKAVGTIETDVSTGVAGRVGPPAEMIPIGIEVVRDSGEPRRYACRVAPVRHLMPPLIVSSVASCVDVEGKASVEFTATIEAELRIAGRPPLQIKDAFAGERYQGPNGLLQAVGVIGEVMQSLNANPFERPTIEAIECRARIESHRRSAAILRARTPHHEYLAGEDVPVHVDIRPFRGEQGQKERVTCTLSLPSWLPPGEYKLTVADGKSDFDRYLASRRHLSKPMSFDQHYATMIQQLAAKRTEVVARLETGHQGLAVHGTDYPDVPAGVAEILAADKSSLVLPYMDSVVARRDTNWSIEGSQNLTVRVVKKRERITLSARQAQSGGGDHE